MQGKPRDFLTSELVTEAAIAFIHIRARSLVFSDAVRYSIRELECICKLLVLPCHQYLVDLTTLGL